MFSLFGVSENTILKSKKFEKHFYDVLCCSQAKNRAKTKSVVGFSRVLNVSSFIEKGVKLYIKTLEFSKLYASNKK